METAKVDIRKLQLLNDRINQSIDALNQVRLSVHGLSHTSGINPNVPTGAFGVQDPRFGPGAGNLQPQVGFPQQPVGFPQVQQAGFPQLFGGGLSHTPMFFGGQAAGLNPYAGWTGAQGGIAPYMAYGGIQQGGLNPYAGFGGAIQGQGAWNPYAAQQIGQFGGLSHSAAVEPLDPYLRPVWNDPLLAARVAQTFPYAQFAVPPVVTLY